MINNVPGDASLGELPVVEPDSLVCLVQFEYEVEKKYFSIEYCAVQ